MVQSPHVAISVIACPAAEIFVEMSMMVHRKAWRLSRRSRIRMGKGPELVVG